MKYTRELSYPASPDAVQQMLLTIEYRNRVADATGALKNAVTIDGSTVTIEQVQPVKGVPAFAKKFAGDSTMAIQRENWTSSTSATYEIETPGKPTRITGSLSLIPHGDTTTARYDLEIVANVPLVGGKLEKLVAQLTDEGYDLEHKVGLTWLTENQ